MCIDNDENPHACNTPAMRYGVTITNPSLDDLHDWGNSLTILRDNHLISARVMVDTMPLQPPSSSRVGVGSPSSGVQCALRGDFELHNSHKVYASVTQTLGLYFVR